MKKIVIITDRFRIAETIAKDLMYVFKDKVEIEKLTLADAELKEEIDGDVLLFTLGNRIERVKNKIKNLEKTLVVRRTIEENKLMKILEIPKNTKVLVVNDNYENTLQTVSLLYDLNIDNIELKPYKEGEYDDSITIAVTPGEVEKVPKYIKNIIDIGDRCVDLSTFMDIIYRLNINDDEVSVRLIKYTSLIVNSNEGIKEHYKDTVVKNHLMERVIEMSEQGILITLPTGEIVLCNNRFKEIACTNNIKIGITKLSFILDESVINILDEEIVEDKLVRINDRDILIRKNKIVYGEGIYQNLYYFKDITYVKSLEQTIAGKNKSNGFVAKYTLDDIIHKSSAMNDCIESAKIFAKTQKTILIQGESGTGKELVAQSIHNMSERKCQPFVAINCAAVPANLLESELFGYEKGAFTGASKDGKSGLFEYANNGTIFLDEIGDMPYELQSRLLRVIQEKQVMRIGSDKVIDINIRIIAATNRDLLKEIQNGNFRSDLYYRISVLPLNIPPLRERKEDIKITFLSFINKNIVVSDEVLNLLEKYDWPGNIRELRNVAEYFELMHNTNKCLPDYLLKYANDNICSNSDESIKKVILKLISNSNNDNESIGRDKILSELKRNYDISEYKLRGLLTTLEDDGFIHKAIGRRGTVITKKGMEFIKY